MVLITKYEYALPWQTGFVARDRSGEPIAVSKSFNILLDKLHALAHSIAVYQDASHPYIINFRPASRDDARLI